MKHKKGFEYSLVKNMIILVISVIGLMFITGTLLSAVGSQSTAVMCGLNAIATDLTLNTVKWNCPIPDPIQVTQTDLERRPVALSQQTIQAYLNPSEFTDSDIASLNFSNPDEKLLAEYNMNRIIADQLRDCYIKTGNNRAQIFSRWYKFMGPGWNEDHNTPNEWENQRKAFGLVRFVYPIGCGVCSVVYVPEELQQSALGESNKHITTLTQYLRWHPAPLESGRQISMYDYLELEDGLFRPDLRYRVTDVNDPLHIVIQRHEVHLISQGFDWLTTPVTWGINLIPGVNIQRETPEPFATMRIIPQSQLVNACTFIANEFEI